MQFYNLIIRDLKLAFYSSTNFLLAASFLILILILNTRSKVRRIESAIEIQINPLNNNEKLLTLDPKTNGIKIKIRIKKLAASKKLVLE